MLKTQHFSNFSLHHHRRWIWLCVIAYTFIASLVITSTDSFKVAAIFFIIFCGFALFTYWLMLKSVVSYTFSAMHIQQRFFRGGWVLKWSNIIAIEQCMYDIEGWQRPLPWIGLKLKEPSLLLSTISPRIISDILLSQRALLYIAMKKANAINKFEESVLDTTPYLAANGDKFVGLQAMLANRMRYQRQYAGYDLFISTSDLGMPAEDFIGQARRYLAAAEPDEKSI